MSQATVGSSLDISAFPADCVVSITVLSMSAASGVPTASIVIEDSVDAFVTPVVVAEASFTGPILSGSPVTVTFRKPSTMATLRLGVASAVMRSRLAAQGGTTPAISWSVGMQY